MYLFILYLYYILLEQNIIGLTQSGLIKIREVRGILKLESSITGFGVFPSINRVVRDGLSAIIVLTPTKIQSFTERIKWVSFNVSKQLIFVSSSILNTLQMKLLLSLTEILPSILCAYVKVTTNLYWIEIL